MSKYFEQFGQLSLCMSPLGRLSPVVWCCCWSAARGRFPPKEGCCPICWLVAGCCTLLGVELRIWQQSANKSCSIHMSSSESETSPMAHLQGSWPDHSSFGGGCRPSPSMPFSPSPSLPFPFPFEPLPFPSQLLPFLFLLFSVLFPFFAAPHHLHPLHYPLLFPHPVSSVCYASHVISWLHPSSPWRWHWGLSASPSYFSVSWRLPCLLQEENENEFFETALENSEICRIYYLGSHCDGEVMKRPPQTTKLTAFVYHCAQVILPTILRLLEAVIARDHVRCDGHNAIINKLDQVINYKRMKQKTVTRSCDHKNYLQSIKWIAHGKIAFIGKLFPLVFWVFGPLLLLR